MATPISVRPNQSLNDDFRVGDQLDPAGAAVTGSDGATYIVSAWRDAGAPGGGAVRFQVGPADDLGDLSSNGALSNNEVAVDAPGPILGGPAVVALANGAFAILWTGADPDTGQPRAYEQRFVHDSNTRIATPQGEPTDLGPAAEVVAVDLAGGSHAVLTASAGGVALRVVSDAGSAAGTPLALADRGENPDLAALGERLVAAFEDGSGGVRLVVTDPAGGEPTVGPTLSGAEAPALAALADGRLALAFVANGTVQVRLFTLDAAGRLTQSGPDIVAPHGRDAGGAQETPDLVALPDGGFVLGWSERTLDGPAGSTDDLTALGQRFGADGLPLGDVFPLGDDDDERETGLALVDGGDGRFTALYATTNAGGDVDGFGIGGASFAAPRLVAGTPGNDSINGTGDPEVIDAGAGNDTVHGGGGEDTLRGGDGDDILRAFAPGAVAQGPATFAVLEGGAGNDHLVAGDSNGRLDGGVGDDTLDGGENSDTLDGGAGNDRLDAGGRNDEVHAGLGADTVRGGTGSDDIYLTLDGSADLVDAGEHDVSESDTLYLDFTGAGPTEVDLRADTVVFRNGTTVVGVERFYVDGGSADDTLIGGEHRSGDTLKGRGGNDELHGRSGDDSLDGGGGADTLHGGDGNDTIDGDGYYADMDGDDLLVGGAGENALAGGGGDDRIESSGSDTIDGGAGEDTVAFAGNRNGYDVSYDDAAGEYVIFDRNAFVTARASGVELFSFAGRLFTADTVVAAPPAADDDAGALGEDGVRLDRGAAAGVLANDFTLGSGRVSGVAGGEVGEALAGRWGTLTLRADGSYSYALSASAQALGAGEVEVDTFAYTLSDGRGGTDEGSLAITVTGANDRAALGVDRLSGKEDVPLVVSADTLLANDRDPDRTDTLTLVRVGGAVHGSVALDGHGRVVFTADRDYNGPASFTYTATDGREEVTATVEIALAAVNDAPVADDEGGFVVVAGQSLLIKAGLLLANDGDPDGGALTVAAVSDASNGTVTRAENGDVTFTAAAGSSGVASFTYTVSDGRGGFDTATVGLVVRPAENPALTINGTERTDILRGSASAESIFAKGGADLVLAGGGNDQVRGGDGWDALFGADGNDRLWGEAGNDALLGEAGQDTLDGGAGCDLLTGGADADRFVFGRNFGSDAVLDFRAGAGAGDVLDLSALGFADLAAVRAAATECRVLGVVNTVIDAGSDGSVTLIGVRVSQLASDDFAFG